MATLSELRAQRDALIAARNGGVRSTSIQGEEVQFKSDSEMAAAIAAIDRQIAQLEGKGIRTFKPFFSKGF